MCDGNYIKLNRKMLDWEWYNNQNTKDVFIHCLLKANWKDGKFQGVDVPRGSFISSYANIAVELGISVKSVRTAINHLIRTSELASKGYSKFSLFTVVKYEQYQEKGKQIGKQGASKGQAKGNNRRKKEGKKERNIYSDIPELQKAILDFIDHRKQIKDPMTDRAVELMIRELNKLSSDTTVQIEILNQSILNGWKGIFELKQKENKASNNRFNNSVNKRDYSDMDFNSLIDNFGGK